MFIRREMRSVLAIAIVVRVIFFGFSFLHPLGVSTDFTNQIIPVANNIVSGRGFTVDGVTPWAWKGPLYPLLTALFVILFGKEIIFQRIFMVLLDLLCIPFIMNLGERVFRPRVGFIAGLIWAFYIPSIWLATALNYEAVTTFLLLAALTLLLSMGLKSSGWAIAAGLLLSLTTLCRASTLLMGPFLLLMGFFGGKGNRDFLRKLSIFALFSILGILPWTVRNYQHFHTLIPVAVTGSVSLFLGSEKAFLTATREKNAVVMLRLEALGFQPLSDEPIQRARQLQKATIQNYRRQWRENPRELVDLYITKSYRLFFYSDSGRWDRVLALINLPIGIFSLLGVFAVRRKMSLSALILFGTVVYFWLFHMPFHSFFRFLLPAFPIFILFASDTVERVWCFLARKT